VNACLFVLCLSLTGGDSPGDRWIAEDKFKHFFTSYVVTALGIASARAAGLDARQSLMVGAGVGAGAGVWKEIRDARLPEGHASVRDLVWDAAGVGAAVVVGAQAR
jgi:uncharacterized protein YfiM (DUF2279 family)